MGYLVDKYAKNDSLYPKDPKTRAVINQRLYFDLGNLYSSFAEYYVSSHLVNVTLYAASSHVNFNRSNREFIVTPLHRQHVNNLR